MQQLLDDLATDSAPAARPLGGAAGLTGLLTAALTLTAVLTAVPARAQTGQCVAVAPCGDINESGTVTASDALGVLRESVELPGDLVCACTEVEPACPDVSGLYDGELLILASNCSDGDRNGEFMVPIRHLRVVQDGCDIVGIDYETADGSSAILDIDASVNEIGEISGDMRIHRVQEPPAGPDGGERIAGSIAGDHDDEDLDLLAFADSTLGETCTFTLNYDLAID